MTKQKTLSKKDREKLKQLSSGRKNTTRNARRIVKYGAQSFRRNNWLSVAAIIIMSITLIIISITLIATHIMSVAMDTVKDQVDMSVYIKQEATKKQIKNITTRMKKLESVERVSVVDPESANEETVKKIIKSENITDKELIEAIKSSPNRLPWTINIKIRDLNDTSELEYFVYNDKSMKNMLDAKPPSFSSSHRNTIARIGRVMGIIRNGGLIAAVIFTLVSIIIIYNTIRMAIFNRQEEIYMMKLVGADRGFIRGPFLVEAAIYGIIAAFIAILLVVLALVAVNGHVPLPVDKTVALLQTHGVLYAIALVFCGILIGIISALFATRKYLKVQ